MADSPNSVVPVVSVIVVSYNHARYVAECLDSIAGQLFGDFELVVVDDNSQDDTAQRVREWSERSDLSVRLVVNAGNQGICRNLNHALSITHGEFVSYVSADDRYEPSKLEVQVDAFRSASPAVAVVYSDVCVIDGEGRTIESSWFAQGRHGKPPSGRVLERLIEGTNFVPAPSAMIRRSALEGIGGYDETMLAEDFDTWLRLARDHEFLFVPEVVAAWRLLPSSLSNDHSRIGTIRLSRARALDKCLGSSPTVDRRILRRNWAMAMHTIGVDRSAGFALMDMVIERDDRRWRRAARSMFRVPGVGPVVSGSLALRDVIVRRLRRLR